MIIGLSGKKQHGKDTVCKIIQYLMMKENLRKQGKKLFDGGPQSSIDPLFHFNVFTRWPDSFKEEHSRFKRKFYAEKLKQMVCLLIGCTMEQLEDNDFKNKPLGEEWRRWFWTNYHCNKFKNKGRITKYYATEEEAKADTVDNKYIPDYFGTSTRLESELLTPRIILQELGTEGVRNVIHPKAWINALFAEYKPLDDALVYDHLSSEGVKTEFEYPNWIITDVRFPDEVEAIKDRGGYVIRVENPTIQSTDTHASETSLDDYQNFDGILVNKWNPNQSKEDQDSNTLSLMDQVEAWLDFNNFVK